VRATLAAITRQMMGLPKRRCRARAVWFLLAPFVFLFPSRSFATVTITVSPTAVNLPANGSQQFTATVTGTTVTSVTWTIQEGSSGGTVSNAGLYSAPGVLGTYHVVATSNANSTQSATATLTLSGFIHSGLLYSGSCTATLLPNLPNYPNGAVLYTGGQLAGLSGISASGSDNAEIYDPIAQTSAPTGNMTIPRCGETATLLPNGKVLFVGGQTVGGGTAAAELYDPIAGTFTSTGSMSVARFSHTATLLPSGEVLIAGGESCTLACVAYSTAELYDPTSGNFSLAAGSLLTPYTGAAAILLNNGKVLIAGGLSGGANLNSFSEVYDPATGLFTQTGAMVNPREAFTATLLQDGTVLFAGGEIIGNAATSAAEIYDPSIGAFTVTGSMNFPRENHTASFLPINGQVLIAGGTSAPFRPASAELYDPQTGTFILTGSLQETRINHTATALANSQVIVAAGSGGQLLCSIETYDPTTGIFTSPSVFMKAVRTGHGTTRLADGRVLLTGGQDAYSNVNSSAEIYDPAAGSFSLTTGLMNQGRYGHTATILQNGNVLVVGGYSDSAGANLVPTAELFNPVSGTFSPTSSPNVPRAYHTATLLGNGMVLIAGGEIAGPQTTTSIELYDPAIGSFTLAGNMSAPRYNHTATLLNDGRVLIAEGVSGSNGGPGNQVGPDDLYDPSTGQFAEVGPHFQFSQTTIIPFDSVLLANGQVLVDEGTIFDPVSDALSTFNAANTLNATLQDYKFLLLPNHQVFVAGGQSAAYLFDPTSEAYSAAGTMEYFRASPTAALLSNGQVLVAGGAPVAQVEFYVPPASASNISPILSLLNPPSVVAGGPAFTLNVFGFNFVSGSVVNFNGAARQTTYLSATELSIAIATTDIAAASTATITVTNPLSGSGGGGTSNPVTLTISSPNVQPVVGTFSPASVYAGGPSFTLSLFGNNFTVNSAVTFNGNGVASTFSGVTELQASIPASAIAFAGTPIVTVTNPGGQPSVVTFTVNNPVPQETLLSPSTAPAGSAALALSVSGSNFNPSSSVLVNGVTLPITSQSSTLLQATLPASDLALIGTLNISVYNPAPGGGTTSALPFAISGTNVQPVVGALVPASATAGGLSFTLIVTGSNFTKSSVVSFSGNPVTYAFVSATELQANIPASAIALAGTPTVMVANPGTLPSVVVTFFVNNPVPQESLLSPSSADMGSAALTMDVTGSNFNSSSSILINGAVLPTTFVSSTLLQASLPANDLTQSGTLNVSVNNPAPGGGTTSVLLFTVAVISTANNPVPQVSLLSPSSAVPGSQALTLDVTGTNFISSSSVLMNGAALPTTYLSSTHLQAIIPASDLAQAGTLNVSVKNPTPGGGTTSALPFTIGDYILTASTSSKSVNPGEPAVFSLTVAPSNGTYTNPITLAATVPAADATASFAPSATVTPGNTSQTVMLTIATTPPGAASANYFPRGDRTALLLLCLFGMAFALEGLAFPTSVRRMQRLAPQLLWALLFVAVAGLVACSGSVAGTSSPAQPNLAPGTPAGTYTITVTATSGTVSHSTSVTLTVM
jgi:hypothetical protein